MKTDHEIYQLVINELRGQPYLNSSEICVSVKNGVVILTGFVESEDTRIAVQNLITNVVEAKCIADNIKVVFYPVYEYRTGKKDSSIQPANESA